MRQSTRVSSKRKMALPQIGGKALLTFAFCLVFSFGLWMLQVFREVTTMKVLIPLEYVSIPNDLILLDSLPSSVTVQVRDRGGRLFDYLWFNSDDSLRIDCSPYFFDNGVFQVSTVNLEQMLRVKFPKAEVSVIQPQSIHSYYTKGTSKSVSVNLRLNASFAKQKMQSGDVLIEPQRVMAYASADNLELLDRVFSDSISLYNLADTTCFDVQLPRLKGVKLVPNIVRVKLPVEAYVEKHFMIKVEHFDVPKDYSLKTFPQEVSIVCFLPMSRYKDVLKEQFQVGVRFVQGEFNREYPVEVIRKPKIASEVRINPQMVEILLERNQ